MFDKVNLPLGIRVIEKLVKTHDKMRKENPSMAEQSAEFVIDRLCEVYLNFNEDIVAR